MDWIAVAVFFGVAFALSWAAAHWPVLALPDRLAGAKVDDALLVGLGPALGAVAASLVRPAPLALATLPGRSIWWTIVALLAPAITLGAFGVPRAASPHFAGAMFGLSVALYCIGEELGWRGYFFNAFAGLPLWRSALTTAALWYAWHWSFLAAELVHPQMGLGFGAGLVGASFGLAAATRRTRSSGLAAAWHAAAKTLGMPLQIAAMLCVIVAATWRSGPATDSAGQA